MPEHCSPTGRESVCSSPVSTLRSARPTWSGVWAGNRNWFDCCVDLGSELVDTRSNAEEAKRWIERRRYKSVRLVTSDWHMRRGRYEFHRQLDKSVKIIPDAVRTEPDFMTLFGEYNKYLLRRLSVWLDI